MDVYLASGNLHKFEEFVTMVMKAQLQINFYSAEVLGGMPEIEESGATLEENAVIKAEALGARGHRGQFVLSDDSGLIVDALGGAPGVYSARYAGPGANTRANNIKLLQKLGDLPIEKRTARFKCVLCFLEVGGSRLTFEGSCEGHILMAPSGHRGFGYDPVFRPLGYNKSFAELGSAKKHGMSHRARAFAKWAGHVRAGIA